MNLIKLLKRPPPAETELAELRAYAQRLEERLENTRCDLRVAAYNVRKKGLLHEDPHLVGVAEMMDRSAQENAPGGRP